jgi:3-methylfumaryl-CoA hydratase
MFAGRRIELPGDLKVGDEVVRTSRVTAIEPKTGRSGEMCFVTVRHELATSRGLAVVEEQDVVYRPALERGAAPPASAPGNAAASETAVRQARFSRTLLPDTTLLFRYSAITNNAHRIHYDLPYARDVEGYPALVVNGGLSTLLLWELAGKSFDGRLRKSTTRNLKPLFVDRTITLCASPGVRAGSVQAWVQDDMGAIAIEADLEFA